MSQLFDASCAAASDKALEEEELALLLGELPEWARQGQAITRRFCFTDHYRVMAFVNAVAWISHREDHHPEMRVGYNTLEISYSTHSSGGISRRDLICAAKVSRLAPADQVQFE